MRFKPVKKHMLAAIREARKNFKTLDGGPFGACVIKNGRILAVAHNTVLKDRDPTCHAEINAIRKAARALKTFDLSGCDIYSTTEPCPMCFSAIHWARIDRIIYGSSTRDALQAGFHELMIPDTVLKKIGGSSVQIAAGWMREECRRLFHVWGGLPQKRFY